LALEAPQPADARQRACLSLGINQQIASQLGSLSSSKSS
jgi:hypothetical protein